MLFFTFFFSSVITAYPIVIFYRIFLHKNSNITKNETHLIFIVCGISICIFNYGFEVYHSLISVSFTYVIIHLLYKSKYLVPVSFTFHISYLLIGESIKLQKILVTHVTFIRLLQNKHRKL